MDKDRITAIAERGEQIKTSSAEYLWICRGIKPPLLPDKPVTVDTNVDAEHICSSRAATHFCGRSNREVQNDSRSK